MDDNVKYCHEPANLEELKWGELQVQDLSCDSKHLSFFHPVIVTRGVDSNIVLAQCMCDLLPI